VLGELRATLPPPAPEAAVAIGGAPECDPYMLPTALVEIVLRQLGWRAQSLGSRLPFATLAAAVEELKPDIFWLSVSHIDDEAWFVEGYREFQRKVGSEVAIVVGGRALVEPVRRQIEYAAYCDNLQHLEAFAKSWQRSAKAKRAVAPNVG
jgi:methanogenic corrinoid protein MtbC1